LSTKRAGWDGAEFMDDTDLGVESPSSGHLRLALIVAAIVVALDQATKWWAVQALEDPPRTIDVIGSLRFNLVFNKGSAFSVGTSFGPWIGVVAFFVVLVILFAVRRVPDRRTSVLLGMVLGGALGNMADRAFRGDGFLDGAVIDFVDLQWWPVWNLADASLVVAGGLLLWFGSRASA